MSVFDLAFWLGGHLSSVYRPVPGGNSTYEIDEAALESLYSDFSELISLTEEKAALYGEVGQTWLERLESSNCLADYRS